MKKIGLIILGAGFFLSSCTPTSTGKTASGNISTPTATIDNIVKGKTIYENSCGNCHDLPNPAKFSDEKWVEIMNWMAPKAKFTNEQKSFAYLYVTSSN